MMTSAFGKAGSPSRRSPGAALVGTLFVLLLWRSELSACSCAPPPPPLEALGEMVAVFHGRVLELIDGDINADAAVDAAVEGETLDRIAVFEVSQVWKGPAESRIEVSTPTSTAACGIPFQPGAEYIVYAQGEAGALETFQCTRTAPYQPDEALALGEPVWALQNTDHRFRRGDVDGSGEWDVTDVIASLSFQFLGTYTPSCLDALDVDDSGGIDISDPVAELDHQFLGGSPPAEPFRDCGDDPSDDTLSCEGFRPCDVEASEKLYHVFDNGTRCVTFPCPSWTVRSEDEQIDVSEIDISSLDIPVEERDKLLSELAAGRRIVRGFLRDGPVGPAGVGTTLVITALPEGVGESYRVASSGIVCVTWPCPSLVARAGGDDDEGILFTDLDIRPLGLSDRDSQVILQELVEGLWRVRGVFVKGPKGPAGLGTTLVVLDLEEAIGPPRIRPPEVDVARD